MTDRPKIPRHQRERIFQRSLGICQREGCEQPIDIDTFHVSHLRAHAHGGAPVDENLEAWCSRCNLTWGCQDVRDTRWQPREWQLEALDRIVKRITNDGVATVSAAPGAGKTVFAGFVFEALRDADVVDRMVVLVPRKALVEQWVGGLQKSRHLELKSNSAIERRGQHGVVVTYQSLTTDNVEIHQVQAEHGRTLIVADEVHHVGESKQREQKAWAAAIRDLAGTVEPFDLHVSGVLNMSGTLWRSDLTERISTVRYIDLNNRRIQAHADYEIGAERLITDGELRPVDIFRLNARVEVKDWAELSITNSDIADLDEDQSRAAIVKLPKSEQYLAVFVRAVLDRLEWAHRALNKHHVKALIVAPSQEDARTFRDEVDKQMAGRKLPPLAELAISDEPDAITVLDNFRRSKRVGVLCTVGMAGEGYDCPDIAVVGFASNKLTKQFVHQVVARGMRVTDIERKLRIIPCAVVVPDVKVLIDHLIEYLAPYNPEILTEEPGSGLDGSGGPRTGPQWNRFDVDNIEPTAENVTVADGLGAIIGHFPLPEVEHFARILESVQLRGVDAARTMVAANMYRASRPFDDVPDVDGLIHQAAKRAATMEEHAKMLQKRLHKLERWWVYNGDTNIGVFAGQVNEAASIANGGREQATPKQLADAVHYAATTIEALCARTGKRRPKTMENGDK